MARIHTVGPVGDLRESLYGEIANNPSEANVMPLGTRNGQRWLPRDGGTAWTACNGPDGQVKGFHFDRSRKGRVMFATTGKGIWRSEDGGQSWAEKTSGLKRKEIQGFAGGSNSADYVIMLYCSIRSREENGTFEGGIYCSRDRGESWHWARGRGINMETKRPIDGPTVLFRNTSSFSPRGKAADRGGHEHKHGLPSSPP